MNVRRKAKVSRKIHSDGDDGWVVDRPRRKSFVKEDKFTVVPKNEFWVTVDDDDINSVEQAEKLKLKAENAGYTLYKTEQIGFSKFRLRYKLSSKGGSTDD